MLCKRRQQQQQQQGHDHQQIIKMVMNKNEKLEMKWKETKCEKKFVERNEKKRNKSQQQQQQQFYLLRKKILQLCVQLVGLV